MNLEDYFEITKYDTKLGPAEQIRIKGTRISIEHVLDPYLAGDSPESILHGFRHVLSLEQVYATITYYFNRRHEIDQSLQRGREIEDQYYQEYLTQEPSEVVKRMRALAAERDRLRAGGG